jgi:hypothetical protein
MIHVHTCEASIAFEYHKKTNPVESTASFLHVQRKVNSFHFSWLHPKKALPVSQSSFAKMK